MVAGAVSVAVHQRPAVGVIPDGRRRPAVPKRRPLPFPRARRRACAGFGCGRCPLVRGIIAFPVGGGVPLLGPGQLEGAAASGIKRAALPKEDTIARPKCFTMGPPGAWPLERIGPGRVRTASILPANYGDFGTLR